MRFDLVGQLFITAWFLIWFVLSLWLYGWL